MNIDQSQKMAENDRVQSTIRCKIDTGCLDVDRVKLDVSVFTA